MNVPIQLVEWGVDRPNVLRTLLYLKKFSDGFVRESDLSSWSAKLEINTKTLKRHLSILAAESWVNPHRGVIYLRSTRAIKRIAGFTHGGKYYISKDNFKDIKSWLFSNIVHRLGKHVRKAKGSRFIKKEAKSKYLFAALSVRYIAKCLGTSKGTVQRLKKHALSSGAIRRERNHVALKEGDAYILKQLNRLGETNYVKYDKGYYLNQPDFLSPF